MSSELPDPEAGPPPSGRRLEVFVFVALLALALQGAWLAGKATPTLGYATHVLTHAFGGLVFAALLCAWAWRRLARSPASPALRTVGGLGVALLLASAGFAAAIMVVGNTRPHRWMVTVHWTLAAAGAFLLLAFAATRLVGAPRSQGRTLALAALMLSLLAAPLILVLHADRGRPEDVIQNPKLPPLTMDQEAMGGKGGPFHPSSVTTSTEGLIPSKFFMKSQRCGDSGCHPDIFAQWNSSMHHFSSFNNQFYRKSIEYMQSVVGTGPSKWCGGCHDPAILMSGMMDTPIAEIVHSPEAQAGLACTLCHSITAVDSTMGQGDFKVDYPPLHELADSDNPVLAATHDFIVRLNPRPHAKTFLKPFHRDQQGEFCSSCHKVHLDVPVNAYRWIRGFNEYDNWQASGVSGMGARSFYYPPAPKDCADCHMPLTASQDKGNVDGMVHSHRFAAANTAVPLANRDQEQLDATIAFLKNQVTIDVFALARDEASSDGGTATEVPSRAEPVEMASTFAVGEEGGSSGAPGVVRTEAVEVTAPLDATNATVRRGESVRVDVVVRTRGVGHFFPGGTVDSFDCWVELKAHDSNGRTVFWSGSVEDDGKGPVEPGAHFYRSLMIDEHGNPINKRNAWATRATVYVRLVPPGAADTVHYRVRVPEDCGERLTFTAKLNYRKFAHFYTGFAYAGEPSGDGAVSPGFDDRTFTPTGDTSDVSGELKEIPDVPIVEVAAARAEVAVIDGGVALPETVVTLPPNARERWNDYGIGLLLQGDLTGALHAFTEVTRIEPGYVDGWVNVARVRLREGGTAEAKESLARAFAIDPKLARAHFFQGTAERRDGDNDKALAHLMQVFEQYPKDRVVLNEIAHVHFLDGDFQRSVEWARKALAIDPEDLNAHYRLMLAHRGAGDLESAKLHEAYYVRFKVDEDAQVLTQKYRIAHPHDNNERQPIHEHLSAPLVQPVEAARTTASVPR